MKDTIIIIFIIKKRYLQLLCSKTTRAVFTSSGFLDINANDFRNRNDNITVVYIVET